MTRAILLLALCVYLPSMAAACEWAEAAIVDIDENIYAFTGIAQQVIGPFNTGWDRRFGGGANSDKTYGLRVVVAKPITSNLKAGQTVDVVYEAPCGGTAQRGDLIDLEGRPIWVIGQRYKGQTVPGISSWDINKNDPPVLLDGDFHYSPDDRRPERRLHYIADLLRMKSHRGARSNEAVLMRLMADPLYGQELPRRGKLNDFVGRYLRDTSSIKSVLQSGVRSALRDTIKKLEKARGNGLSYFSELSRFEATRRSSPETRGVLADLFRKERSIKVERIIGELIFKADTSEQETKELERTSGPIAKTSTDAEGRLLMNVSEYWRDHLASDTESSALFLTGYAREYDHNAEVHAPEDAITNAESRAQAGGTLTSLENANARWALASALLHQNPEIQDAAAESLRTRLTPELARSLKLLSNSTIHESPLSHEALALKYRLESIGIETNPLKLPPSEQGERR